MASLASGFRHARCTSQLTRSATWQQGLAIRPKHTPKVDIRRLNTDNQKPPTQSGSSSIPVDLMPESSAPVVQPQTLWEGVKHFRHVPATGTYFSREPTFNNIHVRLYQLLTKYHDLPMTKPGDAPPQPWLKLDVVRSQTGEPIKAAHFAKVIRVAKRLNLIEPSLRPREVDHALKALSRDIDTTVSARAPLTIDKHGRAVGVGRRKVSTARAFVVEGTGEVLINGKPINEAFGRIHDRESALWALNSTGRMDKYNVWVIVRGGGTTGQAEAIAMAIANGLVAHEPGLKTALRKAGCITRDPRMVERKKHGRVKARKGPTWVKR